MPAALILLKIFAWRARIFKNFTFASHGPKTLRRLCSQDYALNLDISKTTSSQTLKINIGDINYVHSARFITEFLDSLDQFDQILQQQVSQSARDKFKSTMANQMRKVATEIGMEAAFFNPDEEDVSDAFPKIHKRRSELKTVRTKASNTAMNQNVARAKNNITMSISAPLLALPMTGYPDRFHPGNNYYYMFCPGKMRLENIDRKAKDELALFSLSLTTLNVYSLIIKKDKTTKEKPIVMPKKQVISNTDVRLNISRFNYVPPTGRDYIINNQTCDQGEIGVKVAGAFASPIDVSFTKSTFEQLLRTLDSIMFNTDIDMVFGQPKNKQSEAERESSTTEKDRSPTNMESTIHPGTFKKHTPLKAKIKIPINLQLYQDLGDNSVVKVANIKLPKVVVDFSKELYYHAAVDLKISKLYIYDNIEMAKNPDSSNCMFFETLPVVKHLRKKSKSFSNLMDQNSHDKKLKRGRSFSFDNLVSTNLTTSSSSYVSSTIDTSNWANSPKSGRRRDENIPTSVTDEELIEVKMTLIDPKSQEYTSVYDKWNRTVNVNLKGIQTKLNLRTFVTILDFFSIGTEQEILKQRSKYEETQETQQVVNSKMVVGINNLRLQLNKDEYTLGVASLSDFKLTAKIRDDILNTEGSIYSLSLIDRTKFGDRYQEKVTPKNKNSKNPVISFKLKKYGQKDSTGTRDFDMSVEAKLYPIYYVHTNRFHQELISYLVHMTQLLEVAQRGYNVGLAAAGRQGKIKLNIELIRPVVILPESGYTDRCILLDLGYITVKNTFTIADIESNNSKYSILYDKIHVHLKDMMISTGTRKSTSKIDESKLDKLTDKFDMKLIMLRNLDKDLHRPVPDTQVLVDLRDTHFQLDSEQYWVVRGFLDHNLGEPMPEFIRPEFLKHLEKTAISDKERDLKKFKNWVGMYIKLSMTNVTIELGNGQRYKNLKEYCPQVEFDLNDCVLEFTSFSDNSKRTSLQCKAFKCKDVKNTDRPSKYSEILTSHERKTVAAVEKKPLGRSFSTLSQTLPSKEPDNSQNQIDLTFDANSNNTINLNVILHKMRLYLDPLWLKTTQILVLENPFQERHSNLRRRMANLLKSMNQTPPQPVQQTKQPDIKLDFISNDSKFVLIEDFFDENSSCIVLSSTFLFNFKDPMVT